MCRYFSAALIAVCGFCTSASANDRTNAVRVLNEPGKAWIVRYHRDDASTNGEGGDIAIQLRIFKAQGDRVLGVLYRYDSIYSDGDKLRYRNRDGSPIPISGKVTSQLVGTRCRVKIQASGYYHTTDGDLHAITLEAVCHPGESSRRGDDRLVIDYTVFDLSSISLPSEHLMFSDAPVISNAPANAEESDAKEEVTDRTLAILADAGRGPCCNAQACCDGQPCCDTLQKFLELINKQPRPDKRMLLREFLKVLHACDDESDDDVLEEEPFEEEPEYEDNDSGGGDSGGGDSGGGDSGGGDSGGGDSGGGDSGGGDSGGGE